MNDKMLELIGENKELKEKVKNYKKRIEELELEKLEIVRRYRKQNDELIMYIKEVGNENKSRKSKK